MRPMDHSIIIKMVDVVAKFNKAQEVALTIQQEHAQEDMRKQNKINSEILVKASPIIMNSINCKAKKRGDFSEMEKKKEKLLQEKRKKSNFNNGRWIDTKG